MLIERIRLGLGTVVVSAIVFGAPTCDAANPAYELLQKSTLRERARVLGTAIESAGYICEPTEVVLMGLSKDEIAFYTVACENGRAYMIAVQPDAGGSSRVTDCAVIKAIGANCWETW